MKENAKFIRFNDTNIVLIPVNDGRLVKFNSSLEKSLFLRSHTEGTFDLCINYAVEYLYMVIDTEGTGWNVSGKTAVTYNEAVELVNHYL